MAVGVEAFNWTYILSYNFVTFDTRFNNTNHVSYTWLNKIQIWQYSENIKAVVLHQHDACIISVIAFIGKIWQMFWLLILTIKTSFS